MQLNRGGNALFGREQWNAILLDSTATCLPNDTIALAFHKTIVLYR